MRKFWILALVAAAALPVGALAAFEHLLGPAGTASRRELVAVQPGTGLATLADELEARHLLKSSQAFRLYLRAKGWDRSLKAGIYAIAPAMSGRAIAEALFSGRSENDRVTVPEGFSMRQIAKLLDGEQAGAGERFLALTGDAHAYAADYPWLAELPSGSSLEGFLFPDTYVVVSAPGVEAELIKMMLARFEQVVLPAYKARQADHPLSLAKTVTLASIVEKEARHAEERPTIAGVFFNRLAQRIPLGSDPTVEYALNKHQGARGLSFKDVAVDSPYNTYKYPGLPPGPIANPGLASVQAVLDPAQTPYLYFVARGDGTHAFTRTYADHLAAQRRIVAARNAR